MMPYEVNMTAGISRRMGRYQPFRVDPAVIAGGPQQPNHRSPAMLPVQQDAGSDGRAEHHRRGQRQTRQQIQPGDLTEDPERN